MSEHTEHIAAEAARYVAETRRLSTFASTTEETFYPAIRDLLTSILRDQNLPFEVRTGTSEAREEGTERPDFILADSGHGESGPGPAPSGQSEDPLHRTRKPM